MKVRYKLTTIVCIICTVSTSLAQNCSTGRAAVANAKATVTRDMKSIRMLNAGITSQDLEEAQDQSEEGFKKAVLATISALMDGVLSTPEASLNTKSIAGYHLKNGLGSIGTGQANTLIGMIREEGGAKQALIPVLRSLSQMSGKTQSLEYLDLLSNAASSLKSTAELGASKNTLEETEALFGIAAAIVGRGDLAVSVASSIVNTAYTQTQVHLLSKSINQLTSLSESQLQALRLLSARMHRDVQDLNNAKSKLQRCENKGANPDSLALTGLWGDCKRDYHTDLKVDDTVDPSQPLVDKQGKATIPFYLNGPADDVDMRVDQHGMPFTALTRNHCIEFGVCWHWTKTASNRYECQSGDSSPHNYPESGVLEITGRSMKFDVRDSYPNGNQITHTERISTLTKKADYVCPTNGKGLPANLMSDDAYRDVSNRAAFVCLSTCLDASSHAPIPTPAGCQ